MTDYFIDTSVTNVTRSKVFENFDTGSDRTEYLISEQKLYDYLAELNRPKFDRYAVIDHVRLNLIGDDIQDPDVVPSLEGICQLTYKKGKDTSYIMKIGFDAFKEQMICFPMDMKISIEEVENTWAWHDEPSTRKITKCYMTPKNPRVFRPKNLRQLLDKILNDHTKKNKTRSKRTNVKWDNPYCNKVWELRNE